MIIGKTFHFEAGHHLPNNEEVYGVCRFPHGHSYKLIVEIEGEINEYGMVMNFRDLTKIVNSAIIDRYDHQNLNKYFKISTAEMMLGSFVAHIQALLPENIKLHSLTLYETEKCYAKFIC